MKVILTEEQFKLLMTEGQECDAFQDITGAQDYDDVLKQVPNRYQKTLEGEVVQMTPNEYYDECARIQNTTVQDQFKYVDQLKVYEIARAMAKGEKYYLPWIDYSTGQQEGRHRVRAAELLGCQVVKVAVFNEPGQSEVSKEIPKVTLADLEPKFSDVFTDPQGSYVVYKHEYEFNGETSKFLDLYPDADNGAYLLDALMTGNRLEEQTNEVNFGISSFILDKDLPDLTSYIWETITRTLSEEERKDLNIVQPDRTFEALELLDNFKSDYSDFRALADYLKKMLNSCLIYDFCYWNQDFFDDGLENGYEVELVPKAGIMKVYSTLKYNDPAGEVKSGKEFLEFYDVVLSYERLELPVDHGHYEVRQVSVSEYLNKFPPVL